MEFSCKYLLFIITADFGDRIFYGREEYIYMKMVNTRLNTSNYFWTHIKHVELFFSYFMEIYKQGRKIPHSKK